MGRRRLSYFMQQIMYLLCINRENELIFVGQDKLRDLWRHYYPGTNGIIFVVDSADKTRLNTAKEELHLLMNEHELQYATCLVLISFHLSLSFEISIHCDFA